MKWLLRILATALVAAIGALGLRVSSVAATAEPVPDGGSFTYDIPDYDHQCNHNAPERGTPASSRGASVPAGQRADEHGLLAASACLNKPASFLAYVYDTNLSHVHADNVQTYARSASQEDGGCASRSWPSLELDGVAVKTRKLDKVDGLPCNCFVAGTKVQTADGEKSIEDIDVGERVWAKDLATGESHLRAVTGLFQKYADEAMSIIVADGAEVTVTDEHPFHVAGEGWVMSGDLRVGDELSQRDGTSTAITSIKVAPARTSVYNFTVAGDHNYYVTEAQLLVHNCDLGASIASHIGKRRLHGVSGSTEDYIESVINGNAPLADFRSVGQSGRAVWRDGRNIIIRDPTSPHGGTAFSKPNIDAAIRYFEDFE